MPSSRSDRDFLKELKKKEKKRRKQKRRRRHHSDSSSDSSSEDSDMDLQKELYPISHYANDREEMINQVFSVIKGKKLRSMLPPFLADLDIDEVKALCLEQLIGMSKKRVLCTLTGQEMVDSSDTDDEDELSDSARREEIDSDTSEESKVRGKGESSVSQDPNAATNLKKVHRIKIAKKPQTKIVLKGDKSKIEKDKQKEGEEKGKTLMELLELEMRARAIKALLMKSGKDESEAETLAIEEALDEQKKKQENQKGLVENASTMKEKHLRKRTEDSDDENDDEADNAVKDKSDSEEEPERVFNSETNAMSKARDALLLSENKKRIEDEIKTRKEEEAKFLYEEQLRKEKEEVEREEREKLVKEVKMMKQKLIEEEQEQRRKKIEEEKERMRLDHERKEALKQIKDKEKLLSKIQAMKDEEEKEKEELQEHYKTKMQKKVVDRADDEGSNHDEDEEQKPRRYRKKDEEGDGSEEERRPYDRSSSRSRSRSSSRESGRRRPYSRDQSEEEGGQRRRGGKTRLRRKVADGSDVEDGEVEEVDSDAEDEIEREEDQVNLLEKMKNLRKKFSEMEDSKTEEEKNSNPSSPQPPSTRGGRGRARGGARGRGRGRGKPGQEDDEEWSMQKYDFEAPDVKDAVESHKPNFVKAPPKVLEKQDGNSDEEKKEDNKATEDKLKPTFKRVSRDEWNKMNKTEKKKYLKERKKWKLSQTVFIKDDSDNEQLTDDEDSEEEDLKYSDSEDEKEKQDRLAREALKSYAGAFEKEEAPEDYKLVMRRDVVEHELADADDYRYETVEDIEFREKREKLEMKEQERKAKMREDRLRRMQAFQANSVLREELVDDQENMEVEVEVETVIEKLEPEGEKSADDNPFYSSYEALEKKDVLEDPLKEERERVKAQQEEDEKELKKIHHQQERNTAVFDDTEVAPPQKKAKIEIGSMSLGALKTMIESDKEKIQKELDVEGEKTKDLEKKEKDVRKKKAEQVLRRSKRRGDPNNPSKEEVDAAQELEQMTWQDRYMKNRKVKDVVEKSQLLSKVKNKMKEDKKEKDQETAPGLVDPPEVLEKKEEKEEKNSMIGSIEEYASLVGTSVSKLAETKYEVPDVEEEDDEDESDNEGDDLWGAIMGGS